MLVQMWEEYSLNIVLANGFSSEVKLNTAITAHMAIPNAPSLFYATLAPISIRPCLVPKNFVKSTL